MTASLTIAAAQTVPVAGAVAANLERHLDLIDLAAREKTRLLVFPELSLTGYELELGPELAFTETDARLAPLLDIARARAMTLVVGAPLRLGTYLHIGAFVVSPHGQIDVYTKHHLGAFPESAAVDGIVPPREDASFQPGTRNPLVRLGDTLAAIAVCADANRPSHPRSAAERGARLYLASMFVIPSELERDAANLASHAARHSMTVVFANYGGPSGGLASGGQSAIWSATGELLVQLDTAGSGIALASASASGWIATRLDA
jgi:predicted amidohydrolase